MFQRQTNDGRVVFEVRKKLAGRMVPHTLVATTATDTIREQRKWLAERDAGVRLVGRSDPSLRELRDEWEQWARNPGSNYAARTVDLYAHQLDRHVLRILGGETKATAVTPTHLRRLIDPLNAEGNSGSTIPLLQPRSPSSAGRAVALAAWEMVGVELAVG